jgi:hypothetical protein
MDKALFGYARRGAAVLVIVVAVAACSGSTVTAAPSTGSTPPATPSTAPTDTPAATLAPTAVPTAAAPTATPNPTPAPTAVTPGATSRAAACTGSADHQAFFASAAAKLRFDVYCAALPKGWYLASADYKQPNGGKLVVTYKAPHGATIEIDEGNFCADPATCWASTSTVGAASFGDRAGTLYIVDATPTYGVYVDPNTSHSYVITGKNLTEAQFKAIAAGLVKVPKS